MALAHGEGRDRALIAKLKSAIAARGLDATGMLEKAELVRLLVRQRVNMRVKDAKAARPARATPAAADNWKWLLTS